MGYSVNNRCVDIVVGLQAGSEAKGKLISVLKVQYKALVRTGAPNAAHVSYAGGIPYTWHQLPAGTMNFPNAKIVLGANAQIDHKYLCREIQFMKDHNAWLGPDGKPRLVIDNNATLIDPIDKIAENGGRMPDCGQMYYEPTKCEEHAKMGGTCAGCPKLPQDSAWMKLGSTTSGSGANAIRRILRGTKMARMAGQVEDVVPMRYANEDSVTKEFACDTVALLGGMVDRGEDILLEGTQGIILSLYHGYRGKTTSRDTTPATWCSEAGISPLSVRDVYGVARVYPIRVAGESGPMSGKEITWDDVTRLAGSSTRLEEKTSSTKRVRRVFLFGDDDFRKALCTTRPNRLCLTFVDYIDVGDYGKSSWADLSDKSKTWVLETEKRLGVHFDYLSTGPEQESVIIR